MPSVQLHAQCSGTDIYEKEKIGGFNTRKAREEYVNVNDTCVDVQVPQSGAYEDPINVRTAQNDHFYSELNT